MPSLLPSLKLGPFGTVIWYTFIAAVILGLVFAGGLGGALVFIGAAAVVLLVVYIVVRRVWGIVAGV